MKKSKGFASADQTKTHCCAVCKSCKWELKEIDGIGAVYICPAGGPFSGYQTVSVEEAAIPA